QPKRRRGNHRSVRADPNVRAPRPAPAIPSCDRRSNPRLRQRIAARQTVTLIPELPSLGLQTDCGTRILRVVHGRDARATFTDATSGTCDRLRFLTLTKRSRTATF